MKTSSAHLSNKKMFIRTCVLFNFGYKSVDGFNANLTRPGHMRWFQNLIQNCPFIVTSFVPLALRKFLYYLINRFLNFSQYKNLRKVRRTKEITMNVQFSIRFLAGPGKISVRTAVLFSPYAQTLFLPCSILNTVSGRRITNELCIAIQNSLQHENKVQLDF